MIQFILDLSKDWNSYNIANLIVNIFIAIGTIGACWISINQNKIKIKSSFSIGKYTNAKHLNLDNKTDYLTVFIVNASNRIIKVNTIGSFYYAYKRKDKNIVMQNLIYPSQQTSIAPGTKEIFALCSKDSFNKFCKEKHLKKNKLKLFVCLDSGEIFKIKNFEKQIQD